MTRNACKSINLDASTAKVFLKEVKTRVCFAKRGGGCQKKKVTLRDGEQETLQFFQLGADFQRFSANVVPSFLPALRAASVEQEELSLEVRGEAPVES